ncbi:MAG: hypothetical protein ABI599_11540 [Flavobacteriales bacterium]
MRAIRLFASTELSPHTCSDPSCHADNRSLWPWAIGFAVLVVAVFLYLGWPQEDARGHTNDNALRVDSAQTAGARSDSSQ